MEADEERQRRWNRRWAKRSYAESAPIEVLTRYAHLLPSGGTSLDLACGLGCNALYLAERGFASHAWDYSEVAIERVRGEAARRGVVVEGAVCDLARDPLPRDAFDVIVVARFLERELCAPIAAALRPGGLLYYQSFVRERVNPIGPDDVAFRFAVNELLRLFPGLWVRAFHDEGRVGDTARGIRDESLLVAQRPPA